jgi:hypothetical protein
MRAKEWLRLGSALAAAGALAVSIVLVAPTSSAYADAVSHRPVAAREAWTDTGIRLRAGASVTITATGLIHFGSGPISRLSPAGIPWGRTCSAIAEQVSRGRGWPAPGLSCWSLIGRIGSGKPFEVGARRTLHIAQAGELFLGVNDNYLADNSGTWSAAIALTAATTSPPTAPSTTSPTIAPAKHGGGAPLLLIVLLLLAVLVAVVVYWRIYASRHRGSKEPEPFLSGDERNPIGDASPGAIPRTAPPLGVPVAEEAGADAGFVDVNIFQVDLLDGCALRVGYNYFPEGTVVSWKVSQRRAPRATGEFITNGGGSRYHFVTAPFDTRLAESDAADVLFTWTIGDVPFRYSVKRDPE